MFQQRYHAVELAQLMLQVWDTHQIDVGARTINAPGVAKPPKWLTESMVANAERSSLITFTPRTPYPDRIVYQADGVTSWVTISSYHWHEEHPVNGILFRLEISEKLRRYIAVAAQSVEWHTIRGYLHDSSTHILEGFYVRDYDPVKQTFRYYPAQEVADKALGVVRGHRWHRRRFKAVSVFLKLDEGGYHGYA